MDVKPEQLTQMTMLSAGRWNRILPRSFRNRGEGGHGLEFNTRDSNAVRIESINE